MQTTVFPASSLPFNQTVTNLLTTRNSLAFCMKTARSAYAAKITWENMKCKCLFAGESKISRMFLRVLTGCIGWIRPQKLQDITFEFLDGSLIFRIGVSFLTIAGWKFIVHFSKVNLLLTYISVVLSTFTTGYYWCYYLIYCMPIKCKRKRTRPFLQTSEDYEYSEWSIHLRRTSRNPQTKPANINITHARRDFFFRNNMHYSPSTPGKYLNPPSLLVHGTENLIALTHSLKLTGKKKIMRKKEKYYSVARVERKGIA